ncbi:MAG: acetyltransferase [Phycisphaerales bacterium]|jgi:GNAT superfamily N-acetyltransferase|nr:acetyltransferase [Phycisphaerales bacterium]
MGEVQIRELEELSLCAWPADTELRLDGWVLRFTRGYTRRANSVHPIYDITKPPAQKLRECEQLYGAHNLPTIFKITSAATPANVDALLENAGYRRDSGAHVLTCPLPAIPTMAQEFRVENAMVSQWIAALVCFGYVSEKNAPILASIVGRITVPICCAMILENNEPHATGLGVLQGEWLGLFDIVTRAAHRGQGKGSAVVQSLLTWGQSQGAKRAYLQVVPGNAPAERLYAKFGFTEAYEYWYRVAPD